ncbi:MULTISPECIES: endonuclease MutS2 [Lactobacillus]|uniref:endonuclease MutS2 n=1 Tax=Lactobacillus TaxID=1578 RepID=UPI000D700E2B|nr:MULTISPECIES: endonuclease MutS2 [Lactobacillus]AWN33050.1 endonuclease MutS2 [Lactobacillus helsingborgensis]RMC54166.1 endonuclease MutS2 [Lactobacillus sp. ESL0262]
MNDKILKTLEFAKITEQLEQLAITRPAKMKAINLVPSSDFAQVELALKQTLAGADILRIKGQLPLTDFTDVRPSTKRLRIKANLNAKELGNLLLVLALANEINEFFTNTDAEKLDLTVISPILAQLEVPQSLYATLNRSLDFDGEMLDAASSELSHLRHELKSNDAEIKDRMDGYIKGSSSKYLSEQIVTIRDERYVIPVKQEYRNKFGGVVHDQSASGQTLFIEPSAVLNLNNRQQNLLAKERREINRILHHLSDLARVEVDNIDNIAAGLVKLDFIQAKARLAQSMRATEPRLTRDQSLSFLQARHPLINPKTVVANDIRLGEDFDTILITGPNTGGKTITLKTVGILQLMAQSGLFIPAAEGSKAGIFKDICADIGDEQSIEQSLSTFSSHINGIVKIMKKVDAETLVLIDEIGAGTDPEEGASLAISILDFLRQRKAKIIVTTHYPELKLYGYNRERTTNASMEFDLKTLSPTYRLQIGIPGHSNAFAIARRLGMREDVVKKAQGLMSDQNVDINQMITELTKQTKAATDAHNHLATSLDRAQKLELKLEQALDWYNQRVQKQLEFAQERANEVVAKSRKKADKIIAQLEQQKGNVKQNEIIAAKGEFNQLERQNENLAHNRVLQREKRRHHVNVGDQVKVLSYGQTGTITKKLAEHEYEVQMGIIKVKVSDRDIEKIGSQQKSQSKPKVSAVSASRRSNIRSELDLRGQRYDEAMTNLDRYIDSALLSGLDVVTIIHGIGTGAIRKGVWQYLKTSKHVKSYNYAPANEGGNGATIVHLQ